MKRAGSSSAKRRAIAKPAARGSLAIGVETGRAISLERMHAQRLIAPLATPAAVVAHLLAVQAQDFGGAKWALAQRASGSEAEVDRAFDAGEILRTHVLRPTWHFVAPDDLGWLLALTAAQVHRKCAPYYKAHGLTAAKLSSAATTIAKALRGGAVLTRAELGQRLGMEDAGNALANVMLHAELERVVVSGPRRGKQQTYALFDDKVGASRVPMPGETPASREPALAELARRFVASHGPTRDVDLAWWAGLTLTEARRALELATVAHREPATTLALTRRERDGLAYFQLPGEAVARTRSPIVRLLPNYDELLVSFADRSAAIDPRVAKLDPAAIFANVVTSNGRVIGLWKRAQGRSLAVACTLLIEPTRAERAGIAAEVARFGVFAELPAAVAITIDPAVRFRR